MKHLAILTLLALAGCAGEPRIETQVVKVPVYQKTTPPAELMACPVLGPLPVFLPVDGKPTWAALDEKGQHQLIDLLLAQKGCVEAWRAWAE